MYIFSGLDVNALKRNCVVQIVSQVSQIGWTSLRIPTLYIYIYIGRSSCENHPYCENLENQCEHNLK
ncbi:hypothetical protein Hanom_Chr16g01457921 [Helianthus anomalus]